MHQWRKFGENPSTDTGDIAETWKSGMYSVMLWPWPLTFWPQNLISSSLSRDAPVTKVWRKSVNRYWRYRGNIKLPRESRTHGRSHGRTTRKHIASAGAYRRRRLKKIFLVVCYTTRVLHVNFKMSTRAWDYKALTLGCLTWVDLNDGIRENEGQEKDIEEWSVKASPNF